MPASDETPTAIEIRALRRRLFWVELWLAVLMTLVVGAGGVFWALRQLQENARTPRERRTGDGGLRIFTISDAPFVVTHLLGKSPDESARALAELKHPLVIADSGGGEVTAAELRALVWRSRATGQPVRPPAPGAPLTACYYRLEFSKPWSETR